jgi:hypothetical protein
MKVLVINLIILFNIINNTYARDNASISDEDILKYNCSSCHSLNIIYQQRLSSESWKEIILLMYKENGMEKLEKEYEERLITYLSKNYNY